jgi:peptide/nickel transport system substrate-binding protein
VDCGQRGQWAVLGLLITALLGLAVSGATAQQKGGRDALIGPLEGPTVITDPAEWPRRFQEAPQLAALVQQGKLPPVQERLGSEPLVIKPVHEIGRYGGVWRRGFTGPGDKWNGYRCCSGPDHVLFWDYTGSKIVPNVARGWEVSADGRIITLFLRRGMKWSDGHPFTADDFLFWYEDMYGNPDLVPTKTLLLSIHGKPGKVEKVNDFTIRLSFPEPYYLFPELLAGATSLGGHASNGANGLGLFAPKHYLRRFHPKYTHPEILARLVQAGGHANWVNLLKFKNDWALNPELPVLTPWKTTTPINNTTQWVLERNPYYWAVDTAGNQLPYIDKVVMTLGENLEVINLHAMAGEYDFQSRHLDIGKVPVFLDNQQRGGYRLYLDPADSGCDACLKFNLNYAEKASEVGRWLATADFRRALALGIDREQLNEIFWLGLGVPGSLAPAAHNPYYPGPEYRTMWSTYDPEKAHQLLDALGLHKKDAEGFRLRTDGKGRLVVVLTTLGAQYLPFTQIAEMLAIQWKKIGIKADVIELERSLAAKRVGANEQHMRISWGDGSEHLLTYPFNVFPFDGNSEFGPLYGLWFQSNGSKGKRPPPRLRWLYELYAKALRVPEEERRRLGQEIWKIVIEEQWSVGLVGLSPAAGGVRIAKTGLGNVPARQFNSPDAKTPAISHPTTFFWKQ